MSKYRVMIIDDDDDARRVVGLALHNRFEVVYACDGLDALSKLDQYEPDFAIIDVMMPLMDGYQVCTAIRRNPHFKDIQVLFLSAYGTREHIKRAYEVGANLFMTKPVDPERILKNLDFTLSHEPPPLKAKRYTLDQLERMERERIAPEAPRPIMTEGPRVFQGFAPPPAGPATQPVTGQAPPQPHPAPAASAAAGLHPRIMLVDDDVDMLQMLDLALRDDYEIVAATNGIEAVERMIETQPDLMLLDIMMPRMNGYQLLQSIRRNPQFAAMPVIILSAKSSAKDQEYAKRLGASLFLTKPYKIEDLLRTLQSLTQAKTFRIRPKKVSIEQIREKIAALNRPLAEEPPAAAPEAEGKPDPFERWEG